jgi:hypothetical protein
MIYGPRTVLSILIGFALGALTRNLGGTSAPAGPFELEVVGYVIPGLLAIWMDRQGVVVTISSTITASVATRLVGLFWMAG